MNDRSFALRRKTGGDKNDSLFSPVKSKNPQSGFRSNFPAVYDVLSHP
jgi:hypothetical protein